MTRNSLKRLRLSRRRLLQTGAAGAMAFGAVGTWEGSSVTVQQAAAQDDQADEDKLTQFPPEPTPRDTHNYEMFHGHNKREDLMHTLRHPEVNEIVRDIYFGDFEAFDDWVDQHTIGINGSGNLKIENAGRPGLEAGEHSVQTVDTHWIRALLDKHSREIQALDVTGPTSYNIIRQYGDTEKRILLGTIEKEPVQKLLDGKDWYVGIGKVTSISTYSPEYRKGEITFPVFILPAGNEYILVDTGIEVKNWPDDPQPGELVYVEPIYPWDAEDVPENRYGVKAKGRVQEPVQKLATEVSVDDSLPSIDELPDVPPEKRPWLFRGRGHYSGAVKAATPNPVEQNGWTVDWRDSSTDGMIFSASYGGTKVLDRAACVVSLTAYPPHGGRYSTDQFVAPRARLGEPHGNVMFHDNLGLTGPGVLGKMDLPTLEEHWAPSDRPPGFKLRTHYHTGATIVSEFHGGARYGPYNYVIDWQFFEDGVMIPTYQRNGPGYETGHGWPVYASMFAFDVTPGGQGKSEVYWFDGTEWGELTEETKLIADGANEILRVREPGGGQTLDFPVDQHDEVYVLRRHEDEIGVAPRIEDSVREKNFWHPVQYIDGEEVFGKDVVVWLIHTTHTSSLPYKSGTIPFVNQVEMRVKTVC